MVEQLAEKADQPAWLTTTVIKKSNLKMAITVVIAKPVAEVFAYLCDFSRIPEWNGSLSEVTTFALYPLNVGNIFKTVSQFRGKQLSNFYQIIEFAANQHISFKTLRGPCLVFVYLTTENLAGNTQLTVEVETILLRTNLNLSEKAFQQKVARRFEAYLQKIKTILEENK